MNAIELDNRGEKISLFFTPQAAIVCQQIALAAKHTKNEVCGALIIVPATKDLVLSPYDGGIWNYDTEHNVFVVIGVVIPKQDNSVAATDFEPVDLEKELTENPDYAWLMEYGILLFFNGWIHTHPGAGVLPSNIDMPSYERFRKDKTAFTMVIINTNWCDNLHYIMKANPYDTQQQYKPITTKDIYIKQSLQFNHVMPSMENLGEVLPLTYTEEDQSYTMQCAGVWNGFDTQVIKNPYFSGLSYTTYDNIEGIKYMGFNLVEWGLSVRPILADLVKPVLEQSQEGYSLYCPILKRMVFIPPISKLLNKMNPLTYGQSNQSFKPNKQVGFQITGGGKSTKNEKYKGKNEDYTNLLL